MANPPTFSRSATPRIPQKNVSRRPSTQSIRSGGQFARRPSIDPSQGSPNSDAILTPGSEYTYESVYSDRESDDASPRFAAKLAGLHFGGHLRSPSNEVNPLFSPSAPPQLPGDELMYSLASEKRPDEKIFSESFQDAINQTKGELREISLAIWGCTAAHQVGSNLYFLRQQAQSLSEFEPSRTRTVGLVGDSGVGKSSLINSLLDQPDLARSNGDGSACTFVVTEYRFRATHHEEPYGIEVDYMNTEEVKELLEELLRTYRQCYIPAFQEVDSVQEKTEIRKRSAKAWDTLRSVFKTKPRLTKEFVLVDSADAEASVLNTLLEWANGVLLRRPGGANARTWSATASTVDECVDKVDPFVRDPIDESKPVLWPFIRIVRIFLRAAILQTGLVLVDCPSLRDLNYARVRATERYLRNCHEVFAVTTISGALTDQGVRDIIIRNGRHRPLRIVCTKSEVIDVKGTERSSTPDIALQIKTWRQQIDNLRVHVRRCEARRRHRIPGALEEEVHNRDVLQEMEFALKKFLMERRNREIATQLIDTYANEVQLGDLKVFCVSNKDYFEHRHDEQSRAETRLELSGITGLRRYCHSIAAEAQFAAATAFVEHHAPAFLGSLRQWGVAGSEEVPRAHADELREILKCLEETICRKLVLPSSEIHRTKTNLNHEFAASIVLPIRENREEWRKSAMDSTQEWAKWQPGSYAAFCRRYGNYETSAVGRRRWNEELIAPMRLQLESNWGFYQECVDDCKKDLIDAVQDVFDTVCEPLRDRTNSAPTAIRNILDNVGPRKDCIIDIIDAGFDDLIEGTSQIENDALYGHDSSYTNDIMRTAYEACNKEYGPGSDKRRKETISRHIQQCRIFPKLSTMVERHHRTFVRATFDSMIGEITREVDNFVRDLRLVAVKEGEVSEACRYPDFARRLRLRLVQADRVIAQCGETAKELREQRV
ncbi:hypothetical protein K432DRAFT_430339 [Lepidopterella palustris CBS 459.81]|uniref:G domain-containing protein n=1 Tax=Lepidopterella palustris CBS 459.81 TaxID=1314670 RepID=A0A8E2DYJ7_9PEZI|nr:hypothetical protein K432DRAFT_430339 [Lepidopterella palustris CBS 459.81]